MDRFFVIVGSFVMFLGVAAGAFGAHALRGYFVQYPDLEGTYDTAVRYLMFHGMAMFVVAWAWTRFGEAMVSWSGYLFLIGILLFSGSLFLLVLTRFSWFGAITPLGGVAFLSGWLLLALAAWRA